MIEKSFVSAVVLSPFALKGFVKIRSLSGETEHLLRLSSVVLRGRGWERPYRIDAAMPIEGMPGILLVKFNGVDTPEAAKAISGAEILVSRSEAAALSENEYYIEDLKGFSIVDSVGKELGELLDILEGGGGQLAELRLISGETRFVPFRNEFFGEISVERGEIILLSCWILE